MTDLRTRNENHAAKSGKEATARTNPLRQALRPLRRASPDLLGFLLIFFSMLIFLNTGVYTGFIPSWVISGTGVGLLSPAYQSLISKAVPHHMLGIFNGVFYSSIGLVSLPMPYIGAYLWEHFTPRFPFYITAFVALLTIIPSWLFFKLPEQKSGPGEPALPTTEALSVAEPGK